MALTAFKGKLQPSQTALRTARTALHLVLKALEMTCDGLPIPGAQGSINAVLAVLRSFEQATRNDEALEELTKHAKYILSDVIEPTQKALQEADGSMEAELAKMLGKLSGDLNDAVQPWVHLPKQNVWKKMFHSEDNAGEIQALASNVRAAIERYQLRAAIRGELSLLMLKERATQWLINTLPRVAKASHNASRDVEITPCLPGTRKTVLNQIDDWLNEGSTAPVLWLNGLVGTGKSAIAKSFAERASGRPNTLVATFFCTNLDDRPLADPRLIIPTLAFQLASNHSRFRKALNSVLEKQPDLGHGDIKDQFFKLLFDPLLSSASDLDRAVFIIDGLDVCYPTCAGAMLLHLFVTHAAQIPCMRVFVSCRPEQHLRPVFAQYPNTHIQLSLHEVEKKSVANDIRIYLRCALNTVPEKLSLSRPSDWPREADIAKLARRAGRLFFHASLSICFVADDFVRDPQNQLDALVGVRDVGGGNPYSDLNCRYLRVLNNAFPATASPEDIERFKRVLGTVVCLHDTLPIHVLRHFAGESVSEISRAFHRLHSVIRKPDEAPRAFHSSFQEFITDAHRCTDRFYVSVPDQHIRLSLRSLELLVNGLKRGISKSDLKSELRYACRHWATHVRACPARGIVLRSVKAFVEHTLILWLEAMCVLGFTNSISSIIATILGWVLGAAEVEDLGPSGESLYESRAQTSVILEILRDAHHLVLARRDAIRDIPEHIYSLALPSLASSSALFQRYNQMGQFNVDAPYSTRSIQLHVIQAPLLRTIELPIQIHREGLEVSSLSATESRIPIMRTSDHIQVRHDEKCPRIDWTSSGTKVRCGSNVVRIPPSGDIHSTY